MVQPIDQGAIIRSGQAIVPDYAAQLYQQQQMQLGQQQQRGVDMQNQQKQAEQQREVDEETAYTNDLGNYLRTNDPQELVRLAAKYPKKSEAIKRAFDAQDKVVKDADLRQSVSILSYVKNGKPDLAAASLRDRIEKSRASDEPDDPQDTAILEALESGDPERVKEAQGLITYQVAAITGVDNFSKTLGDLNPKTEIGPDQKQIEYYRSIGRDDIAEQIIAKEGLMTVPGAGVFRVADFMGGGDPVSRGGGDVAAQGGPDVPIVNNGRDVIEGMFPGVTVTDNKRDPKSALGMKNPNSFHVKTGGAVDVKPIPGITFSQFVTRIRQAGYKIAEAKNEVGAGRSKHATGDHWHVVIAGGPGMPKKVRSVQEARALPKGTVFLTPDDQRKVR